MLSTVSSSTNLDTSVLAGETANDPVLSAEPKKGRRKTSHLKVVPETRELREYLKLRCTEVAARLNKDNPLTKDEMESIARELLARENMPEGYLGWAMVVLSSEFWRDQIGAIPPSRRLFLLPHCLKHAEGCPADYDEFGMNCKKCGACSIADFRTVAEEMGYKVLVAEGSPVVLKIIVSGYVDAIVGVACLNVLEKAIDKILLAGIPCMAVPLLSSDCRNTSVDEEWVMEMVVNKTSVQADQTRSYVHLLRAANDLFQSAQFDKLAGRPRGSLPITDSGTASPAGSNKVDEDLLCGNDPIAATEALAYDFVRRGGKYSRPFITLAAYDAMNGGKATTNEGAQVVAEFPEAVRRTALSIEMFHKASLVHDDIEDDDGFRYGQPTLHRRFGLPTAINVGDYLIGLGYRMVGRESAALGAQCAADIMDCLAGAHIRLAEGQGAELIWRDARDRCLTPLDALKIYALKTAPAFEAALYTGIRLAGDAQPYLEPIRQFSRNLGVAFQILNDLNDWQGDSHNKLESAGDVLAGRPTILWALALATLTGSDRAELVSLAGPDCTLIAAERVRRIERLYRKAKAFDQAHRLIEKHQQRALEAVQDVESTSLQRLLVYLVDTVLGRSEEPAPTIVPLAQISHPPLAR